VCEHVFFFNGGQGTNYDIKLLPLRQGWRRVTFSLNVTKIQVKEMQARTR